MRHEGLEPGGLANARAALDQGDLGTIAEDALRDGLQQPLLPSVELERSLWVEEKVMTEGEGR